MFGKYNMQGDKFGSNYAPNAEGMYEMIDDFYGGMINFAKSAGAATYGDNGYFNAIMGKEFMMAMFSSDNIWAAMGHRPYNHEGMRISTELATYGIGSDGNFLGIGAETIQDGEIAQSVALPVGEYRQPYKDITFRWDYGLGLMALENKDDVSSYKDYANAMGRNFTDLVDKTILRPVYINQPTKTDPKRGVVETSLNSIYRCIASKEEIGKVEAEGSLPIDANQICPYGGLAGDFKGRASATGERNFSGQFIDANKGALDVQFFRTLYRRCSVNWADSAAPNNKAWLMGNITQELLAGTLLAQNILLDTVYVQKDFNGVKTVPGRDAGILLNSYLNIPIIQDGNVSFDYTKCAVSDVRLGDVSLLDFNHLYTRILTPLEVWTVNNPAIVDKLQEKNVMHMRCETGVDSFIQHGRIVNLGDVE